MYLSIKQRSASHLSIMSKSKTNFNTFLRECEEYEPVGTNGNRRERHQHDRCASASVATTNNGNNIFLNSNSNYANANAGAAAVVDSSKLVLNDDNFPSLSSSKLKPEIQNNKINFKNALSSSSHILLQQQQQQQQEQQKRLAAIVAASVSTASHILVKKESEYIANKIILSKRFSASNETSIKSSKIKISNNDDDCDDDYDDDDDYDNDNGYDE